MFVKAFRSSDAPLCAVVVATIVLGVTLHRGWIVTKFWIFALPLLLVVFVAALACFVLMLFLAG
ncbi:hypothetical protein ACFXPS_26715 [Nocardia sp. NPDC059091]